MLSKIMTATGEQDALEKKIAFLKQLERFERSRRTRDPKTGAPSDDARTRFKLSQAAWASRFENESGRRLSVEDELIRVDWDKARLRVKQVEGAAEASKR